jgi:hypothetical protein
MADRSCSLCGRVMVPADNRDSCSHCDTAECDTCTLLPPESWRVDMDQRRLDIDDQRRLDDGDPQAMP